MRAHRGRARGGRMVEPNGNAAAYFVDRHADSAYRAKSAFIETGGAGRSLSYAKLAEASGRVVDLMRRHGIQPENRVALLVLDQIEFPILFWGALKAGVAPVALNTLLGTDVYEAIMRDSRARALFVSHELMAVVAPVLQNLPDLAKVFVIGGTPPQGALSFESELAA